MGLSLGHGLVLTVGVQVGAETSAPTPASATPPGAPILSIAAAYDRGKYRTDSISNETTPKLTLDILVADFVSGNTVIVYDTSVSSTSAKSIWSSIFTANDVSAGTVDQSAFPALASGQHSLTATITNSAGEGTVSSAQGWYVSQIMGSVFSTVSGSAGRPNWNIHISGATVSASAVAIVERKSDGFVFASANVSANDISAKTISLNAATSLTSGLTSVVTYLYDTSTRFTAPYKTWVSVA